MLSAVSEDVGPSQQSAVNVEPNFEGGRQWCVGLKLCM